MRGSRISGQIAERLLIRLVRVAKVATPDEFESCSDRVVRVGLRGISIHEIWPGCVDLCQLIFP
jgi:hypothetical protein